MARKRNPEWQQSGEPLLERVRRTQQQVSAVHPRRIEGQAKPTDIGGECGETPALLNIAAGCAGEGGAF